MKQLSLNLQTAENIDPYSEDNFVALEENLAALNFLEKFFAQKNFSQSQFTSLILRGAPASGKTHLAHIFANKLSVNSPANSATSPSAKFLQISKITRQNLPTIFAPNQFFILEDIQQIQDEELLLHLINSASEAKAFLLLTSQNKNEFRLKDLTSRLKNIFSLQIKDPGPEVVEILLVNGFARRQIKISDRIVNFVSRNIPRSYEAVLNAVNLIEFNCGNGGKALTLQGVGEILKLNS